MSPNPHSQKSVSASTRRACALVLHAVLSLAAGAVHAQAGAAPDRVPEGPREVVALRDEALRHAHGSGVPKNALRAIVLHCEAARLGDAQAQFELGWIYANGRGVPRDDALAAFFFAAAAAQGIEQARRMLPLLGPADRPPPECMRNRAPPVLLTAAATAAEPAGPPPFEIRSTAPPALLALIRRMAAQYRIEPQLALAIVEAESNFDSRALSPKNARGLMQLIPETAARFDVRDAYDPTQNLRGGLTYLRWLLAYFEGDLALVAAAYNAGEGTVERYRGVPPYAETRGYVQRILRSTRSAVHPYDARISPPSPRLAAIRGHAAAAAPR